MRHTSLEAFKYITESGILGERRTHAYELVYKHGPATGQEITAKSQVPGLWKRLSELEEMGLVQIVSERKCKVTGRSAIAWDVTDKVPTGPYRPKPKGRPCPSCENLRNLLEQSARRVRELTEEVEKRQQVPLFAEPDRPPPLRKPSLQSDPARPTRIEVLKMLDNRTRHEIAIGILGIDESLWPDFEERVQRQLNWAIAFGYATETSHGTGRRSPSYRLTHKGNERLERESGDGGA